MPSHKDGLEPFRKQGTFQQLSELKILDQENRGLMPVPLKPVVGSNSGSEPTPRYRLNVIAFILFPRHLFANHRRADSCIREGVHQNEAPGRPVAVIWIKK